MHEKVRYYIDKLMMNKHPEGGYYNELYRSGEIFEADILPGRYSGDRAFSTSIYFLLPGNEVSTFHRLSSDEIWHFYDGALVTIYIIDEKGDLEKIVMGNNLDKGEVLQAVIRKNSWFGAEVNDPRSFSLVGCTVAPGFDFSDFELGKREELIKLFPQHSDIIKKLTRG